MRDRKSHVKKAEPRRAPGQVLISDWVAYRTLRFTTAAVRAFPLEVASTLMGKAWRWFGPLTKRHGRAMANLARAFPDRSTAELRAIAADHWENLGRTFAEALAIDRVIADPGRVRLEISPELRSRLEARGGLVLVSMHSANWELAAYPFQQFRPIAGLYKTTNNRLIDEYVVKQRLNVCNGGLFTDGHHTPGRIMRWVRGGNAMGILLDRRDPVGIVTRFFGRPVKTSPFPVMVARRLDVPIVAVRVIRCPRSHFVVEAMEVDVARSGDRDADVAATTQRLQDQLECWIKERPGEWLWQQKRWKMERAALETRRRGETLPDSRAEPKSPA